MTLLKPSDLPTGYFALCDELYIKYLLLLNWVVGWDELVPNKDLTFQEGKKLGCSVVALSLGVLAGPEAGIESQLVQGEDVAGFGVEGRGSCGHDRMDDAKGGGLLTLNGGIFNPINFEFMGKEPVQDGVSLGIGRIYGVGRPSKRWVTAISLHA